MKAGVSFRFERRDLRKFEAQCDAALRNVDRGTKKATTVACEEILRESLEEVPRGAGTLAASAFYKVQRRRDTAITTWAYEGIIGYGGNGDPVNPTSGRPASAYMVAVHEDLSAVHPNGKAKFLEDPVRRYGATKLERTFATHVRDFLANLLK